MTLQNVGKAAAANEPIDEIDEIMNEIEQLQQTMQASQAPKAAAAAAPVNVPSPAPAVAAAVAVATAVTEPAPVAEAAPAEPEAPVDNSMQEFQGGGGDVSMEETLANLKDEEPSGPNLIDQAIAAEAAASGEAPTTEEAPIEEAPAAEATPSADLLDAAESEALDDDIAEVEKSAETQAVDDAAIEEVLQEEEVAMSEPRRPQADASANSSSDGGTVALKLSGSMSLKVSYEYEGQHILVGFVDGALRVEFADGTELKIPVRRQGHVRKAA